MASIWVIPSNNALIGNVASNNSRDGIILQFSSSNRIYHNNLMKNTNQGYDFEGTNLWDNGYLSGGNYWSDYIGTDSNGDGIGDTPYNISGGSSADRYPLMKPFSEIIPFPCEGCKTPTDPDSDGIYEDINGNGRKDFNDIVLFFENLEWVAADEPVASFDFNGNGRIDFADVVNLFEEL